MRAKITLLIILIIMICSLSAMTISAISYPAVSVGITTCVPGENVIVPVTMENNIGLVSMSLLVEYDMSWLTLIKVEDTGLLPGEIHTTKYISPYHLTWENDNLSENLYCNGELVNLIFSVSESCPVGDYSIKIRFPREGLIRTGGINDTYTIKNGMVKVVSTDDIVTSSVTGQVTSSDSDTTTTADDTITIQLANAENEYTVTVESSGVNKTVDYSIEDVAEGTYTMTVSKANHVDREYTVVVGNEDVTQDVKICLLGDVTGDGKVNISDVVKINGYVKKKVTLTDYELMCANVTGDTKVNISDVVRVNGYVKKKVTLW